MVEEHLAYADVFILLTGQEKRERWTEEKEEEEEEEEEEDRENRCDRNFRNEASRWFSSHKASFLFAIAGRDKKKKKRSENAIQFNGMREWDVTRPILILRHVSSSHPFHLVFPPPSLLSFPSCSSDRKPLVVKGFFTVSSRSMARAH